ncbi:hypothetical protein BACUNI_01727 [Bacteroides uniformis ATCC 8492]|uniref:Uncharacterized protein n=1 Tax=Bacteroides uniformis (strain ATCC 8492 / DSM 6597 / CCUG 4942 / CIP 103695 / JCM 5828 / KCTC 5204 / NCTC 13054 / VPI 0061) TaxID=411479 RepID=A0ABC9NDB4_BACUC|nr:hypothetical protein BACUNI_01727 [Bacteroides uniformis ATCC 8492]
MLHKKFAYFLYSKQRINNLVSKTNKLEMKRLSLQTQ